MHIIKVFTNKEGNFGNPVGIIIDENSEINKKNRQKICQESGYSEVVFIENIKNCEISIFSPTGEIPFAGHAVIGATALLDKLNNEKITIIRCHGNILKVRHDYNIIRVKADLMIMPEWNFKHLDSAEEIESIESSEISTFQHCYVWAWLDKKKGIVRARTFAPDWLIPEDEANGSGSMLLASKLRRKLEIIHGKGSVLFANPLDQNTVELGGMCQLNNQCSI
ncbi:MAG: PhzF family phenazine biosynthesis protein [Candidatus Dojkabacteria bacterium]|nr:PhzF family phenazine biosynthesis protein [Candidatus Dojkabacteria bacterium]